MTDAAQVGSTTHLYVAADELTTTDHLLDRLHQLIPEQDTTLESTIGSHTRYSAAPIPWNTPAAMLYLDIHAAAREHETNLTLLLWRKATYRGPADKLTPQAIRRLPDLITAAHNAGHTERTIVKEATHDLTTWPVEIRHILDEARDGETPWTRAPQRLRCPDCNAPLYLAPGWQYADGKPEAICRRCIDPETSRKKRWAANAWLGRLLDAPTQRRGPDLTKLRAPDRLVTVRQATTAWGLSPDQVYVWEHRGQITPAGTDHDGRKVYRNAEIAALLVKTRPDME